MKKIPLRREIQHIEKEQVKLKVLFKEGRRKLEIASVLGFDRSTIRNNCLKRLEERESTENLLSETREVENDDFTLTRRLSIILSH